MQVIVVDVVLGATCLLMLGWVVWTARQARRQPFPRIDSLRAREEFDSVNQDWRESVPSRYRPPEQKEEQDG